MKQKTLKSQIFYFMLVAKLFTLGYIWFMASTGGFKPVETGATISMVTPLFMVYISVMFAEYLENRYEETPAGASQPSPADERRIKRPIVVFSFVVFPLYVLAIVIVINQKVFAGTGFDQMKINLGLVESLFGAYLGQIVFTLFKGKAVSAPQV